MNECIVAQFLLRHGVYIQNTIEINRAIKTDLCICSVSRVRIRSLDPTSLRSVKESFKRVLDLDPERRNKSLNLSSSSPDRCLPFVKFVEDRCWIVSLYDVNIQTSNQHDNATHKRNWPTCYSRNFYYIKFRLVIPRFLLAALTVWICSNTAGVVQCSMNIKNACCVEMAPVLWSEMQLCANVDVICMRWIFRYARMILYYAVLRQYVCVT